MKTIPGKLLSFFSAVLSLSLLSAPASVAAADAAPKSPEWLRRAVLYEIFPRNFSAAGNFNGVTARLDELKDFGADVLWLMPIHPIGEKMRKGSIGSPYAVRDYYAINPDYGTADDFKRLVQAAHQRGLKVIMDIVAGHTAWDCVLMKHPEFYKKDELGNIIPPNPGWTDVAALDYENKELRRYMTDMLKYWVREFGVDGFRCDVAFNVPVEFWEQARAELEQAHPGLIMLADANSAPKLLEKAFNMDYSGSLYWAQQRVLSGLAPATFLQQSWANTRKQFAPEDLHLRYSDNHETIRAVARHGLNGALAAQVLMLTLDGVPLFYNGMEAGDATESADPALFEKTPVVWNSPGRPPLRDIYRQLIKLRKANPAFYNDAVTWLDNTAAGEVVTFQRADETNQFFVCINYSSRIVRGSVDLPNADQFKPIEFEGLPPVPNGSLPEFRLDGYEWRVYRRALKP